MSGIDCVASRRPDGKLGVWDEDLVEDWYKVQSTRTSALDVKANVGLASSA